MRCPKCGQQDDKVLDSRSARDGLAIRRRRACLACGQRFTTFEEIVKDALRVVKRDGRHEEFSRLKLMSGIMRACEKRPVSPAAIDAMVDEIVDEIEQRDASEISSQEIGERVMQRLEQVDDVAFVRFASVYRRFADVNQFINAISEVVRKPGKGEHVP
jgi:transcriptional repressor NrdR